MMKMKLAQNLLVVEIPDKRDPRSELKEVFRAVAVGYGNPVYDLSHTLAWVMPDEHVELLKSEGQVHARARLEQLAERLETLQKAGRISKYYVCPRGN